MRYETNREMMTTFEDARMKKRLMTGSNEELVADMAMLLQSVVSLLFTSAWSAVYGCAQLCQTRCEALLSSQCGRCRRPREQVQETLDIAFDRRCRVSAHVEAAISSSSTVASRVGFIFVRGNAVNNVQQGIHTKCLLALIELVDEGVFFRASDELPEDEESLNAELDAPMFCFLRQSGYVCEIERGSAVSASEVKPANAPHDLTLRLSELPCGGPCDVAVDREKGPEGGVEGLVGLGEVVRLELKFAQIGVTAQSAGMSYALHGGLHGGQPRKS